MLSDRAMGVSQGALAVLECMDGSMSVDEIADKFAIKRAMLDGFVEALDAAFLLEGPTFDAYWLDCVRAFEALERLPIRAAADVDAAAMDAAMDEASRLDGVVERLSGMAKDDVCGLVVPHLDHERGSLNYAAGWLAMRDAPRPDRVIVLGTNHFGSSTGVVLCEKGYETNVGAVDVDREFAAGLRRILGQAVIEHRMDHRQEHSVELQMPWIRHVLGEVPVVGVLVHDPIYRDGASYDGRGISLDAFVGAMEQVLAESPGHTLLIASADLSHVGPEFGDLEALSPSILSELESHDRAHLDLFASGDADAFLESMKACENASNWCTLGGMTALRRLLPEAACELVRYAQAVDDPEGGSCCVTSAAMVLHGSGTHGANA